MKIEYAELSDDKLNLLEAFACNTIWEKRQWSLSFREQYVAWRFPGKPAGSTLLALDKGRCVGVLDYFVRKYRFGDAVIDVGEPCDWYCESAYRANMVGLRLMRKLMKDVDLPMIVVGGTGMTQNILPRLGWRPLPPVHHHVLPVRAGPLIERVLRRCGIAHPKNFAAVRSVGRMSINRGLFRRSADDSFARVGGLADLGSSYLESMGPGSNVLANLLATNDLKWMDRAPGEPGAEFVCVFGECDAETFGFCLSRLYPIGTGVEAKIVHVQTSRPSEALVNELIRKTTEELVDRGADYITGRFSDPQVRRALQRNGFWDPRKTYAAYWWPGKQSIAPATAALTGATADEAILPLPKNAAFDESSSIRVEAQLGDQRGDHLPI